VDVGLERSKERGRVLSARKAGALKPSGGKMAYNDELVGEIEIGRQAKIETGGTRRVPSEADKVNRRASVSPAERKGEGEDRELTEAGPTGARRRAASQIAGRVARRLECS
jgi:hypothetical protein